MQKIAELEKLDQRNKELSVLIATAERNNDDIRYSHKKEMYQNKLKMIELITLKNKHSGISASELIDKVGRMQKVPKYETGLSWLDKELVEFPDGRKMGGIECGSLILLGAESGAGKTTLTLDILSNVARYNKCVLFNFEMSERRIAKRLSKLLTTKKQLDNFIIDSESIELEDLLMEITLYADKGIKFFVVDSRMKINVKGSDPEHQKNAMITRELSKISAKFDIIIILINQISEENLKSGRLAFKGSGDQQYDADLCFFIVINEDQSRKLICTKNRQEEERLFSVDMPRPIQAKETVFQVESSTKIEVTTI